MLDVSLQRCSVSLTLVSITVAVQNSTPISHALVHRDSKVFSVRQVSMNMSSVKNFVSTRDP